jgi:hypothetical protein
MQVVSLIIVVLTHVQTLLLSSYPIFVFPTSPPPPLPLFYFKPHKRLTTHTF